MSVDLRPADQHDSVLHAGDVGSVRVADGFRSQRKTRCSDGTAERTNRERENLRTASRASRLVNVAELVAEGSEQERWK